MCLAVPMRISAIEGSVAVADLNGVKRKVRVDLLDRVAIGDYILVHAGLAISRIDQREADETLALLRGLADEV